MKQQSKILQSIPKYLSKCLIVPLIIVGYLIFNKTTIYANAYPYRNTGNFTIYFTDADGSQYGYVIDVDFGGDFKNHNIAQTSEGGSLWGSEHISYTVTTILGDDSKKPKIWFNLVGNDKPDNTGHFRNVTIQFLIPRTQWASYISFIKMEDTRFGHSFVDESTAKDIEDNVYRTGATFPLQDLGIKVYGDTEADNSYDMTNASNIKIYLKTVYDPVSFDLNSTLDGNWNNSLGSWGTADVYINDIKVAEDVSDYWNSNITYGSSYVVNDIKPTTGYLYSGATSFSGTTNGNTSITPPFQTATTFDLNAYLDGTEYGWMDGFGTADVYINGKKVAEDASDYWNTNIPLGSTYLVDDIKPKYGYAYIGDSSYSGTLNTTYICVLPSFQTIKYNINYNGNGATSGNTPSSTHNYLSSQQLSTNGFRRVGYNFIGWSLGNISNNQVIYSDKQSVINVGRNLVRNSIPNTNLLTYSAGVSTSNWVSNDTGSQTGTSILFRYNETGYGGGYLDPSNWNSLINGKEYTISFWVHASKYCTLYAGIENVTVQAINVTTEWKYVSLTGTCFDNQWKAIVFYGNMDVGDMVYVSGIKIEEGPCASAWMYSPEDNVTYTGDVTLNAQWSPIKYNIHYDSNGGSGSMLDSILYYDLPYILSENTYVRTGYEFTGWNTKADGSGVPFANMQEVNNLTNVDNSIITLYAQWKDITPPRITILGTEIISGIETLEVIDSAQLNISAVDYETGMKSLKIYELSSETDPVGWDVTTNFASTLNSIIGYISTNGIHYYKVEASDNAGNVSIKTFAVNILSLNANIVNANFNSTKFVRGDRGLLKITFSGLIERLEITFPNNFTTEELNPNATISLTPKSTDTYNHEFIIPLHEIEVPDGTYTVCVKAFKGDKELTNCPSFTVNGSILDQIKNAIKTYPKTKWN